MTIDNGDPPPDFLRLEAPRNGVREISESDILASIEESAEDPKKVLARKLRALTLEHMTEICTQMGKVELRDILVRWAVAYLDGTAMPSEDKERRL
jgi:hypothetical protein